ncbi:MAG: ABC transporter substrate-binding protein [Chloroflexi bacterium]|nr:ABC transporter substrate-binding protein [Chloroflexota bacterium]
MKLGRRAFIGLAGTAAAGATAAAFGRDRFFGGDQLPPAAGPRIVSTPFSGNASARQDWEALVSEANREATLFILVRGQGGYRRVTTEFQAAFPGIDVQVYTESSNSWLDRVRSERRSGRYTYDLGFLQPEPAIVDGLKDGFWATLRPLVFRPDVTDDAAWRGGFTSRFLDTRGQFCFGWEFQVQHAYAVDSRVVKDGEITSARDLLDPKWRGKVITSDPRLGTGLASASNVAKQHGNDVVKGLLVDQRPALGGGNALIDALVGGSHPIALGVRPRSLQPYRARGEAGHIRFLDLPDTDFVSGTGLLVFNNTAHPAAARLFLNWVLTRGGQALMAQHLLTNSARTDVEPFEKDGVGQPGKPYYEVDREVNYAHTAATQQFVRGLLGT